MSAARTVHALVPAGITDPSRPSGGNTYDRRLCEGLASTGWSVRVREVAGDWPEADEPSRGLLAAALGELPDGAVVLLDGLVASACPEQLVPVGRRLRTVVLVHMPVGAGGGSVDLEREEAVLRAAAAVLTTSAWTRRWLLQSYRLRPRRVHVARPGVDAAAPVPGAGGGGHLLCVGAVTPGKGHDTLVAALHRVADLDWQLVGVGSLSRSPDFVATVRRTVRAAGLEDRVRFPGPRTGADLAAAYAGADLLVSASRAETYGMVVTEALARGLPVLACDVGGLPEALGATDDGVLPGLLVPPDDAAALAGALRRWLSDPELRRRLRRAAEQRRPALTGWGRTVDEVAHVLEAVAA